MGDMSRQLAELNEAIEHKEVRIVELSKKVVELEQKIVLLEKKLKEPVVLTSRGISEPSLEGITGAEILVAEHRKR